MAVEARAGGFFAPVHFWMLGWRAPVFASRSSLLKDLMGADFCFFDGRNMITADNDEDDCEDIDDDDGDDGILDDK